MNVTVNVIFRFHPLLHRRQQFNTSGPDSGATMIPESDGRSVSDEKIGSIRNQVPFLQTRPSAGQIKRPSAIFGLPGGSVDV